MRTRKEILDFETHTRKVEFYPDVLQPTRRVHLRYRLVCVPLWSLVEYPRFRGLQGGRNRMRGTGTGTVDEWRGYNA